MNNIKPDIEVDVMVKNPGQYFACCGLFELANRLWPESEAWFTKSSFCIRCGHTLGELIHQFVSAPLKQLNLDDNTSSPIEIGEPFGAFRLDWWLDEFAGGKELKVWAGTMESCRIALAMQDAMRKNPLFKTAEILNVGVVVYDPQDPQKKVEPYYFDARRCPNAHSRDVGFSTNDLGMTSIAHPAVELLCLVGLQRCRPAPTNERRIFDYFTWQEPLPISIVPAVVAGQIPLPLLEGYRFENWYRTGQKKHKAFRYANLIF
ncbi:MAG: hypothetical protein N2112_09400 [Gemmataceae bacterium]|jgi:CRISPR-associated protein Csb3|nr:hypothetical protein [Gemmataceae bacterium]